MSLDFASSHKADNDQGGNRHLSAELLGYPSTSNNTLEDVIVSWLSSKTVAVHEPELFRGKESRSLSMIEKPARHTAS